MYGSKSHLTSSAAPWLSFGRIQQPGNLDSVLGRRRCGFELCRVHMNLTNVIPHWTVYSKTVTDSTKFYIYLYSKRSSHCISVSVAFFFSKCFLHYRTVKPTFTFILKFKLNSITMTLDASRLIFFIIFCCQNITDKSSYVT